MREDSGLDATEREKSRRAESGTGGKGGLADGWPLGVEGQQSGKEGMNEVPTLWHEPCVL